ncbi:MAG TPA: helix-turn-helix domain-containing protein [Planctomycetota bacterium]|jgi:chromosomal replication initiation ATPase DnaA|nr:helix-turn-helix domain-containing protein [Planctomycetota bacterium]
METLELELQQAQLDIEAMLIMGATPAEVALKMIQTRRMASTTDEGADKPKTLKKAVCDEFKISEDLLFVKTRKREISNARQVYAYVLVKARGMSDKEVGRICGLDRTTVIYCVKTVEGFCETEKKYRELIPRLIKDVELGFLEV